MFFRQRATTVSWWKILPEVFRKKPKTKPWMKVLTRDTQSKQYFLPKQNSTFKNFLINATAIPYIFFSVRPADDCTNKLRYLLSLQGSHVKWSCVYWNFFLQKQSAGQKGLQIHPTIPTKTRKIRIISVTLSASCTLP